MGGKSSALFGDTLSGSPQAAKPMALIPACSRFGEGRGGRAVRSLSVCRVADDQGTNEDFMIIPLPSPILPDSR